MNLPLSGLSDTVDSAELVARFLMSSSWFARTRGRVKHQAFLPAPDNDTSVFRTNHERVPTLWAIGSGELENRNFYGVGVVEALVIRDNRLDLVATEPPAFHANIRGWPIHPDPDLQKSRRKMIAESIAEEAQLIEKPSD